MGNFPPFSFCCVEKQRPPPDLLCRLLCMPCKAIGWIFITDKTDFFFFFAWFPFPWCDCKPGHCSWHSAWYGEYTWQSAMNQLLHSGLVRVNSEPWPSPLFPVPVRLSLSLRFPRETFPFASWQHQPKTFPCLYHHWSSTVSRTTLSPRHHVPRKFLTAWKEAKN